MKKLTMIILAIAALAIGLGLGDAQASNWRYICVADSVAAETADTFYVETGALSKAFRVIGHMRCAMTGATNGSLSFKVYFPADRTTDAISQWADLEVLYWDAAAGSLAMAIGNSNRTFVLGPHFVPDGDSSPLGTYIMGDVVAFIWDPVDVTGGHVSIVMWYQVLE